MAAKALPPQSLLRQLFDYDPATGLLTWKWRSADLFEGKKQPASQNAAIWNAKNAGRVACSLMATGYLETSVLRVRVLAHRVIWKLVHGVDPEVIDHINGDHADNRLENLRSVRQVENTRNSKLHKNNTSGVMGVRWDTRLSKWHARIMPDRRNVHLGVFDSFDEAVAARRAAEVTYGFHKNHGRR